MQYVALLRGINVGGKARVDMAELRHLFEATGCTNVTTYINSGNVLFSDSRTAHALRPVLEAALTEAFHLQIVVVVCSHESLVALVGQIPADWANNATTKTDVIFVSDGLDTREIMAKIGSKPDIESVIVTKGALVWHVSRLNATKSSALKLVGSPYYAHMTIRNINTVRKLVTLIK